ncbi:MAG: bi-domain-containing oxidoreductase [Thermogutta sp.]
MKQLIQSLRDGKLELAEVPPPALQPEGILVRTHYSLISAGTERMVVRLAKKSLLGKARERPDLVRKVWAKLKRDGLWATWQSVAQQLDRTLPLGYSCADKVIQVGECASGFEVGMPVACAGAGHANHAEINYVPALLAAPVPARVSLESAAYATVGAIALQGVRNADCRVGETVAVIGLGLLGQLAVQLLKAAGCLVVGCDPSPSRVELAKENGADLALSSIDGEALARAYRQFTRGRGVDAVLITAATASNAPVELAAEIARDRARIVMVGVTGMNIPRKPYYEKELTFIVSRSYGPGRYDPNFEEHGQDYPIGYVRWTETRNLEAFLDLVAQGKINPEPLTTHRFPIDRAEEAMELILRSKEPYLGVLLEYPHETPLPAGRIELPHVARPPRQSTTVGISFIGAGSFARSVLLPILAKLPQVRFRGVVTASGISARDAGRKYGFAWCATTTEEILADEQTDVVFIVTRHSQHADLVCRALEARKAVFCEKPLGVTEEQLERVRKTLTETGGLLMVGFNRRFAPLAAELKRFFAGRGPLSMTYRVNAGPIPPDHWLNDPAEGGRIIGEACHFFDFFAYLTDSHPVEYFRLSPRHVRRQDDGQFLVRYADGSVGHLIYTTVGSPSFSKERLEVHAGGATAVLEDFRGLCIDDGRRTRRFKLRRGDKGHRAELQAFLNCVIHGSPPPIPPEILLETSRLTLTVAYNSGTQ